MKNQYFGDINDYRKYSLLRTLSGQGELKTAVCWALTPDDARSDGSRIGYLDRPDEWQRYDPQVFDFLRRAVRGGGDRRVKLVENHWILPNSRFFGDLLPDDAPSREMYFDRFFDFAKGAEIVFFDPDNGLSVQSVKRGGKQSSKYVYEDEIERAYLAGHSVLLYQHFPRQPREEYTRGLVSRLSELPRLSFSLAYRTTTVVFVLLPQPRHQKRLVANSANLASRWGGAIVVERFNLQGGGAPTSIPLEATRRPAAARRVKAGCAG